MPFAVVCYSDEWVTLFRRPSFRMCVRLLQIDAVQGTVAAGGVAAVHHSDFWDGRTTTRT